MMQDETDPAPRYRIDSFLLDLGACQLTRNGSVVELPKLSFDLLAALAERAPNVATIDQLIKDVWDGRVVAEETVTQRVKLLRDALAEHGYTDQLVATVRGRGYRLASPVERVSDDIQIDPTPTGHRWPVVLAGATLAVLLLVAKLMWPVSPIYADEKSIAVLPFADFSADQRVGYFGDGIAEELLNRLARIPGLRVTSRTSSFAYRSDEKDIRKIADELGVKTILEGSVRQADDRIRITVQLIDADQDRHIWSQQYDRELTDVLDIQDDVAAAIVDKFQLTNVTTASRSSAIDQQAVDLYLRGRHAIRERTSTSLSSAVDLLIQVNHLQPDYAPAYVALAGAYVDLARRGNFPMDEADLLAGRALEQALILDDQSAEAHATLGLLRLATGDTAGAQVALRHAINLNENLADAHLWLGYSLRGQEKPDEANTSFARALLLDPMNSAVHDAITFGLLDGGNYDAAIRQYQQRLRIASRSGETYRLMALTARTFGRLDKAVIWAREAVKIDPEGPLNIAELVMAYASIGELSLATELAEEAYAKAPDNHWVAALRAFTFINSGDFDSLSRFTDQQLLLVDTNAAVLTQADRMRLALAGLASNFNRDFVEAERRIKLALGDPLTPLLEIQFSIGMLGTLAHAYDANDKPALAEQTIQLTLDLIEQQKGWVSEHLIYADSVAAFDLMRGNRDAAMAKMKQAIEDGWTGHRGFLLSPLWQPLYETDAEFRTMIDQLYTRIDVMRESVVKNIAAEGEARR